MANIIRILSIDGGGIRGIIPAQVLINLEAQLKQLSGDADARIADYFDFIAGTSTGGILSCALLIPSEHAPTRPQLSMIEVRDLYRERGSDIFNIPFWHRLQSANGVLDEKYPAAGLETTLHDYFADLWLSELIKPCMITAYDVRRRRTHFFTQYDAKQSPARDFRVRDLLRATTAAPTYFELANITSRSGVSYPLIDGGVFANNPALCAYAEVRAGYARARGITPPARAERMMILSIGTGRVETPYNYNEAKDWGIARWLGPLLDIVMGGVAETVDYQLKQIYDAVGAPEQYLRIEPQLAANEVSPDLDNVQPENLAALRDLGQETAERHESELTAFATKLVELGT